MTAKRKFRRGKPVQGVPHAYCSLMPLLAAGLIGGAQAQTTVVNGVTVTLPGSTQLPGNPSILSGSGTINTVTTATTAAMNIQHQTQTLMLGFPNFNVGSNASVNVSVANGANFAPSTIRTLAMIGGTDPSVVAGAINSPGQFYMFNSNGILFTGSAQVNVGGLLASTLSLSQANLDKLLNNGLPSVKGDSLTFNWTGGDSGLLAGKGFVAVDAGARITTGDGGKVVLLAPATVQNLGYINVDKGANPGAAAEAILAAGGKVVLTAPDDPNLRGLLVETSSAKVKDSLGNDVTVDGKVVNRGDSATVPGSDNGRIDMGKGVVSLAALAVNQEGRVNATQAVNVNGQIMLMAGKQTTDRLTVTQTGSKAEIDWKSGFGMYDETSGKTGVKQGQTVEFVQSGSGAVAYNFVNDADRKAAADGSTMNVAERTVIDGTVKANGQIFIVNEKGIEFGSHARVAAGSLVATGLGVNQEVIDKGLFGITDAGKASLQFTTSVMDENSDHAAAMAAFKEASVTVQSGAQISTADNGFAILAGSRVDQGGVISTPKGQAILAAGAKVYLNAPYSQVLRGFSAEVDPLVYVNSSNSTKVALRDSAVHVVNNSGTVQAALGNITLVGHNLNNAGNLLATTSATMNGSVRLLARDNIGTGARRYDSNGQIRPYVDGDQTGTSVTLAVGREGGTLTLDAGSKIEIGIDGSGGETLSATQAFLPSSVEALARQINIAGSANDKAGASIVAAGGKVSLIANPEFSQALMFGVDALVPAATATDSTVFIGSGARIDVSGTTAQRSVKDLFIEVELRGDELAGNPVQRDGLLRGQKFTVDIRDAVKIADLSGYIGQVGQTVEERAASGGNIAVRSSGSVVVKQGAELNVSGGQVNYAAADVSETRVTSSGGQSYRLNDAPVDMVVGTITDSNGNTKPAIETRTRSEAGYAEGKSAGSIELSGNSLAVAGTLKGTTVRGERQRVIGNPATDRTAIPLGAKLIVRDGGQHYLPTGSMAAEADAAFGQAQMTFIKGTSTTTDGLRFGSTVGPKLELSESLVQNGFTRFDLRSDGKLEVGSGISLNLGAGGEFVAKARQIEVGGSIVTPGGKIDLSTVMPASPAAGLLPHHMGLQVNTGALLSTAGTWINDFLTLDPALRAPLSINGGSITLASAEDLHVQQGARVDVSGGARIRSDGRLEAGNAGKIDVAAGNGMAVGAVGSTPLLVLAGTFEGYSLGKGGSFSASAPMLGFGTSYTAADLLLSQADRVAAGKGGAMIAADFLAKGGFYHYSFNGTNKLTVGNGITLQPRPQNWSFDNYGGYQYLGTGTDIRSYATLSDLGANQRSTPTSLTLSGNDVLLDTNSTLRVDAGGKVSVKTGFGQLTVLGTIEARGGEIKLSRDTGDNKLDYNEAQQSRSIYLGENSRLLANGMVKLDATTERLLSWGASRDSLLERGLYRGQVVNGGTVDIDAGLGYVITRNGSLIDVSGTASTLNMPSSSGSNYVATTVGAGGGKLNLAAAEGMILDGGMAAAGGAGTTGGSFALRLGRETTAWGVGTPPVTARTVVLYDSKGNAGGSYVDQWSTVQTAKSSGGTEAIDTAGYLAGTKNIDVASHNGIARVDTARLAAAGFGSVAVRSQDPNLVSRIGFEGNVNLAVANQLRLDSPNFYAVSDASNVTLEAAALLIGNSGAQVSADKVASQVSATTTGNARFSAKARDIGLVGNSGWSGFGNTRLESSGEIHFDSVYYQRSATKSDPLITYFNGSFLTSGTLDLVAARLSPSTFSTFTVDMSADAASILNISRPVRPDTLGRQLAGAGSLTFKAHEIKHDGTIEAPLGEVRFLSPNGKVTLTRNSVTSVAATGDILLGQTTQSGSFWKYETSRVDARGNVVTAQLDVKAPNKQVLIDAADVDIQNGATINVSGGGEALAWEFSPGSNGKVDILAAASSGDQNTFAIIPDWNGSFAPTDSQSMAGYGNSLKAGDKIELSNNALGLNGRYTLLPARYALLKGAVLVTLKSGVAAPSQVQADGSVLASAVRLSANRDGSYSAANQAAVTVELAGAAVVAGRAKYLVTKASDFFMANDGTRLPGDAGRLSVAGRNSLAFDPVIIAQRAAQIVSGNITRAGRGAELDLAAPKLALTDSTTAAPGTDWTVLDKDKLNALGVSSLMLGGLRSGNGGVVNVEAVASDLRIDAKGEALKAAEVALVARDNLTIADGSKIAATASEISGNASYGFKGDGAFVRVASGNQATITRTDVTRTSGNVSVEANTGLSGKALMLDATGDNQIKGTLTLANQGDGNPSGGAVSIGAKRISVVGDNLPAGSSGPTEGLSFDNQSLSAFAGADEIRLNSYSTFDLYGDATLGTSATKSLVIGATGIDGKGATGNTATLTAQKLRLENPNPAAVSFTGSGSGTLNLVADQVTFAGNATQAMRTAGTTGFRIGGFNTVNVNAAQEVKTSGIGVTEVAGTFNVNAGRVLAASGSGQKLVATQTLNVTGGSNTAASSELGGKLALRGDSLNVSGRIVATAGVVSLSADKNVNLNSGAVVSADGATVKFADTKAYASAGAISVSSDNGNVAINAGSQLSVSGGEGGDAGHIVLNAKQGTLTVAAGTLRGNAVNTATQGNLSVDANTVALDELAAAVRESANGSVINHLRGLWDIRRLSGDVTLTDSITAAGVRIAADTGNVTIGDGNNAVKSVINASGRKGGTIELYAGPNKKVLLKSDSELLARGTEVVTDTDNAGTRGQGGTVVLGTSGTGGVETESGSLIDVGAARDSSGTKVSTARDGKVLVRVERSDTLGASATTLRTLSGTTVYPTGSNTVLSVLSATGSATAVTLTPSPAMSAYQTGQVVSFQTGTADAATGVTINVSSKGAKSLVDADGMNFSADNKLLKNQIVTAVYDGTRFVVTSLGLADSGTANNYKVAYDTAPGALATGMLVTFRAKTANTAASMLALNNSASLSAALVDANGNALTANSIKANDLVTAVYDGSKFRVVKDLALVAGNAIAAPTVTASNLRGTTVLNGNVTGARSTTLEAYSVSSQGNYAGTSIVNPNVNLNKLAQQNTQAASLLASAVSGIDPGGRLGLTLTPGVEVRSDRDLNVSGSTALPAGSGNLTLRAAGDLRIDGSISSGFTAQNSSNLATHPDAKLNSSGESWAYRLVAGAATVAANPLATKGDGTGSLTIGSGRLVRTGTGDISLTAGRDIVFESNAAVYTAGIHDATAPVNFTGNLNEAAALTAKRNYSGINGGSIAVAAARDVIMASQNPVTDWLARVGDGTNDTQWWGRMASFRNGLATFGGGDVKVAAGRDVTNATVVTPTSGRVPRVDGVQLAEQAEINGGGDVVVNAGGSINAGVFYAETGRLTLNAGGQVSSGATLLAGNASVKVAAASGVDIGNITNPLGSRPGKVKNSSGVEITSLNGLSNGVQFSTYGDDSRVDIASLNGAVNVTTSSSAMDGMAPSRVKVAALNGDINIGNLNMLPGSQGQLDLLAANNVDIGGTLVQFDVNPGDMFTLANPLQNLAGTGTRINPYLNGNANPRAQHAADYWHANDSEPSRIIALSGNVVGHGNPNGIDKDNPQAKAIDNALIFNEAVNVMAGGNIEQLSLTAQHVRPSDVSRIVAGGNISYGNDTGTGLTNSRIQVSGQGSLEIIAGGNVDLGTSAGIVTRGNTDNPYLPEKGASIFVAAGMQPGRYDAVLELMQSLGNISVGPVSDLSLDSGGTSSSGSNPSSGSGGTPQPSPFSANQVRFLMTLRDKLEAYVDAHAEYRSGPRETDASKAFKQDIAAMKAMPETLKAAFFREQYFDTLRSTGREVVTTKNRSLYEDAFGAIETLFPAATQPKGNINMFYSQIRTEQGGDISMYAPGGSITVGIANPSTTLSKPAASQGLFTIRGGSINAYAQKDFLVNQSRVFTLDGGNILVWANTGNIDAGNGAKTVNSTPPPALVIRNGQVVLDTANSVSGSGIGALASRKDSPPADIDLYAPKGTIDAGDAGVRGTGRGFFDGETIRNGANFNLAAGGSGLNSGASAPPPAVATTPASQAADSKQAEATAAGGDKKQGILTVEVMDSGPDVPVGNAPVTGAGGKSGSSSASDKKKDKS